MNSKLFGVFFSTHSYIRIVESWQWPYSHLSDIFTNVVCCERQYLRLKNAQKHAIVSTHIHLQKWVFKLWPCTVHFGRHYKSIFNRLMHIDTNDPKYWTLNTAEHPRAKTVLEIESIWNNGMHLMRLKSNSLKKLNISIRKMDEILHIHFTYWVIRFCKIFEFQAWIEKINGNKLWFFKP